jgi:hypothetical protein
MVSFDVRTRTAADVNDVRSTVGLMIADEPVMSRGSIVHLIAWEPVLRALVDRRPAYEPGMVDFTDRHGAPLDLDRSFSLAGDDVDEMRHFLARVPPTAGCRRRRRGGTPQRRDRPLAGADDRT